MAQPIMPRDPKQGNKRNRRGRQVARAAASSAAGAQWFAPERRYLTQRGPQIAALAAGLQQVRAVINSEKNFYDLSGSTPNPALVPSAVCLTTVPLGDDVQQRSGRTIKLKGWSLRVSLSSGVSATGISNVRVLVVKDAFNQGIAPNINQVLAGTPYVLSPLLLSSQQGRFKILVDDIITLVPSTGSSRNGGFGDQRNYSADLQHHVEFIGSGATTADQGPGSLWLFFIADTVTLNQPTQAFWSRIRYYDN